MTTFTLDTNCLIAVDDNRPEKEQVLKLIAAAAEGKADVAMIASSAAERQIGGGQLEAIEPFRERMKSLGFGHIELLKPIATFDLTFFDHCVWASEEQVKRQTHIFEVLFPTVPTEWPPFAEAEGIDVHDLTSQKAWKWRNAFLDVQAYWAHDDAKRDVFVTSDSNFARRLIGHEDFRNALIVNPEGALKLI